MSPFARQKVGNLVLIAVALGLVVTVLATAGSVTTSERDRRSLNVMTAWREDEITRIAIERGDDELVLEREAAPDGGDETWQMTAPYREEADPFAMQKLIGTLQYASWARQIKPEEVDRAAFGLDGPRMVVHVDMGDIHYRLRLGKDAVQPPGSAYLEVTGEGVPEKRIVIIEKGLIDELDVKADDFRGRYVMPYLSPVLKRLTIEGKDSAVRLRRAEWDGWRFDGMLDDARIDRQALDRVLVQFAKTVDTFVDPGKAEQALEGAETITVELFPKRAELGKGEVVFGGRCPEREEEIVALRKKPDRLAGCLPGSVFAALSTPAEALVDRSLFYLRPDEVETLTVVEGDKKLVLDRKNEGFVMREPREAEVDAEAGNERIESIVRATGRLVPNADAEELGLAPPHGTITLSSVAAHEDEIQKETVLLSAPDDEGIVYALRKQDGQVLELMSEAARSLKADASLVRSRTLLDRPLSDMAEVEVVGGPAAELVRRSEGGSYTLDKPKGYAADAGLATELMDALRTLTADRWVADADDGTFGLGDPSLRVRILLRGEDKGAETERVLLVGRRARSGFYATFEDDPGVFVIPRRVHEVLTTLPLDRTVLTVDPTVVARITLDTPDSSVTLDRHGGQFVQSSGSEQLSSAAIQRIVDALQVVRAQAAVHLGPPRPEEGLAEPLLRVSADRVPGHGTLPPRTAWRIGAGDSWRGVSVHYARAEGVDATYVVPRSLVQEIRSAL